MLSGALLSEARSRAGITQTELGRRVGLPANVISRWERNRVALPLDRLRELVAACGLELDIALRPADRSQETLIAAYRRLTPNEQLARLGGYADSISQLQGRKVTFDPAAMLRALNDAGVAFIVIGATAAALHGAPYPTLGLDICARPGQRNHQRLARALRRLDAHETESSTDAVRSYETRGGALQVVATPAGTGGYRDLARAATPMLSADDATVLVCALADVVRSKDALARPRERAGVNVLRNLAAA